MAAGFRSYVWDPCLIISQIVAVQCVFYIFLALWILLVDFWTGSTRSLDQFFRAKVRTKMSTRSLWLAFFSCSFLVFLGTAFYNVQGKDNHGGVLFECSDWVS